MAFFKSRKGGDEPQASARQAESIEAMRRRAKHRLIGASVLVLIGVVGFPLLFDTQPRPISVDIPIEIPDRNKVKPLPMPAPTPAPVVAPASALTQAAPPQTAAVSGAITSAPAPTPAPAPAATASIAKAEPVAPKLEAKPEPKVEAKPEPKAEPKPSNDAAKALALLEGKPVASAPAGEGRFVVQVGSFSDNAKAREARQKLEHAGMKTYTQAVEKDGKHLIRVRIGPFASKADAEKAADKAKGLELPAAILTL